MKIRRNIVLFCGILIFLSLALVLLMVGGLIYSKIYSDNRTEELMFLHMRVDRKTERITVGKAILSKENLKNENKKFVYYSNSGSRNILYNIGSNVYECLGTCSCEEERRVSDVHNVVMLVAAYSGYSAIQEAKAEFVEDCSVLCLKEKHGYSDVNSCDLVSEKASFKEIMYNPYVSEEEEEDFVFMCTGHCVPQEYLEEYKKKSLPTKEKCRGMILTDIVFVKGLSEEDIDSMKIDFIMNLLNPFCENNSVRKGWLQGDIAHENPWCTGIDMTSYNKNLKCWRMGRKSDFSDSELRNMFAQDLQRDFFRPK